MNNLSEVRHLLVIADQKSRRIVPLTDNTYSIGRDPNSNILLYDRQVSRHHATILKIDDNTGNNDQPCYRIIDGNLQGKKSTNGIAVNGKQSLSHDLAPGDLIRFGNQCQANYHMIADSSELALLEGSGDSNKEINTSLPLEELLSENKIASLDEIFLEDEEEDAEQVQTMSFKKREKKTESESLKNQVSLADANPNPIIEVDFQGQIVYLNAAAKIKFPDLNKLQALHPILQNLVGERTPKEGTSFVREIQIENSFFEQHIHYLKESECLRSYLFEITKYRKREIKLTTGKDRYRLYVKTSIGIAIYPQDGEDGETLLKNADAALYRAKERGRNHYRFYSSTMTSKASLLLKLENLLYQALEEESLSLHYQPQLNLTNNKVSGMEALLRWYHPEFGNVSPLKLIPLAEKTDLIIPISLWILKTACLQNKAWQKRGFSPIPIAVNLSPKQFQQPNLVDIVAQVLEDTALEPHLLDLEITETAMMQNIDSSRETLQNLRELGVQVSLDDFGTGYSSLGYLQKFPVTTLKIDQSFIQTLQANSGNTAIISAIIALG